MKMILTWPWFRLAMLTGSTRGVGKDQGQPEDMPIEQGVVRAFDNQALVDRSCADTGWGEDVEIINHHHMTRHNGLRKPTGLESI